MKLHANAIMLRYGKSRGKEGIDKLIEEDKKIIKELGYSSFKIAETNQQVLVNVKKATKDGYEKL